jgi:hypothetical protein
MYTFVMPVKSTPIGARFGRFVIVARAPRRKSTSYVLCRCDCGTVKEVNCANLASGKTHSCGCLRPQLCALKVTTHGQSHLIPEYRIWAHMKGRCLNPNDRSFARYGGRGITVCERWLSFENFLADMGQRPSPEHSLERKENNDGYHPDNCIWATPLEQANNKRRSLFIEYGGERLTIAQWARRTGMGYACIISRLRYGWPPERIFNTPIRKWPSEQSA